MICIWRINVCIPISWDDLAYTCVVSEEQLDTPDGVDKNKPIENFGDVICSTKNIYCANTGRILVHFVVQCFCGLWTKSVFNVFVLLFWMVLFLSLGYLMICPSISDFKRISMGDLILKASIPFLVFLLILPHPQVLIQGISYSCNYLIPAACVLSLLCLLNKFDNSKLELLLLCLFAVVCGNLHETISAGLSGAMGLLLIFDRKTNSKIKTGVYISFLVGATILFFAPGNFTRLNRDMGGFSINWMQLTDNIIKFLFWPLLIWMVLLSIYIKLSRIKVTNYLYSHRLLLLSILIQFLFIIISGQSFARTFFGIHLWLSLLIGELIYIIISNDNIILKLSYISQLFIVILFAGCAFYQQEEGKHFEEIYRQIEHCSNIACKENVSAHPTIIYGDSNTKKIPIIFEKYLIKYPFTPLHDRYYDSRLMFFEKELCWYYSLDSIVVVPKPYVDILGSMFIPSNKVLGNNTFYQIKTKDYDLQNYLFSSKPLADTINITMKLGDYNFKTLEGFIKGIYSSFYPRNIGTIQVNIPVRHFRLLENDYYCISWFPNTRNVLEIDIN